MSRRHAVGFDSGTTIGLAPVGLLYGTSDALLGASLCDGDRVAGGADAPVRVAPAVSGRPAGERRRPRPTLPAVHERQ